jgi:hypothetical protein
MLRLTMVRILALSFFKPFLAELAGNIPDLII